jgi:outer membrane protein OmpA-like peptidoglycan-associated protein
MPNRIILLISGGFLLLAILYVWPPVKAFAQSAGSNSGSKQPDAQSPHKKDLKAEREKTIEQKIRELSQFDLLFEPESSVLTIRDQEILLRDSNIMDKYPEVGVVLVGAADERGSATYNAKLGLIRAQAAKDFLIDEGIDADRIVVVSFGKKSVPGIFLCAEHKETCWKKHRIVHVIGYFQHETMEPISASAVPPPPPKPTPSVVTIKGQKYDSGIYLLPKKGQFIVENVFSYIHNSSTQVALQNFDLFPLLPGSSNINIQNVDDDYYIDTLTFYYGITRQVEFELDIPYVYRTQVTDVTPLQTSGALGNTTQVNTVGSGVGDIQFGLHWQINTHKVGNGIYMAHLMFKSNSGSNPFSLPIDSTTGLLMSLPTGTGFWTIEPGFTILYPVTPIVLYGNANYLYNVPQSFGSAIGTINPGNATDFNFGGWFSFSPKSLFTIGYDQMTVWPPSENGTQIPLTRVLQMGSILLGASYNASEHFFLMFNVAAGVTPDAPNVSLSLRFPLFY